MKKKCTDRGCKNLARARGLCTKHYQVLRRAEETLDKTEKRMKYTLKELKEVVREVMGVELEDLQRRVSDLEGVIDRENNW